MRAGRRLVVACGVLLASAACGEESSRTAAIGRFEVTLEAPLVLKVRHEDGATLSFGASRALGFRDADATYEMQYGSFLITERPSSEWRWAERFSEISDLSEVEEAREGLVAELVDGAGETIGELRVEAVEAAVGAAVGAAGGAAGDAALAGESLRVMISSPAGQATRAQVAFECDASSAGGFLGFGAQTHDVDHRGQIVPVFVSEQGIGKVDTDEPPDLWPLLGTRHASYLAVPTMVAPRAGASWGLHATTFARSIWDLCSTDPSRLGIEVWEGRAEVLFSPGPSPLDVIAQQTAVTGRAPRGPDWTYGVWMERIGGTQAVLDEARALREARIPVSAIWSEDWRGGQNRGPRDYVLEEDWRWDQVLYAGLPDMIRELHGSGIKFLAYHNTFVVHTADVFEEMRGAGALVKDRRGEPFVFDGPTFELTSLADVLRDPGRAFVRRELVKTLELGVDGWMADFAEWYPADARTVAPSNESPAEIAHHQYPLAWAEVNAEAVAEAGRTGDAVIFMRSGYTGSQGKAQVIWAGDQRTSFQPDDGLPTIIPILLGLGAAGFPITTHDIAGYASGTNPPAEKDLFFRWTSLGALSPVMRTHHGRSARANWRWSSDPETTAHFRRWAELHTSMWPLWASLAAEAAATGAPVVRALALHYPEEAPLHGVKDQFLIGDALLAAPVVTASTARRSVQVPSGDWYNFWMADAPPITGPGQTEVSTPLGELPLFARAGTILPLLPSGAQSLVESPSITDLSDVRYKRRIVVWLGRSGSFSEPAGGRYTLESHTRPPAASELEIVDTGRRLTRGATVPLAAPSFALQLRAPDGATHTFRADGVAGSMEIELEARW